MPVRLPKGRATLIAMLAITVAILAARDAASFVFQHISPIAALQFDSDNPIALIRREQNELASGLASEKRRDERLAIIQRSVESFPLNAAAFRLFSLLALSADKQDSFGSQIAFADRLSRRDVGTQFFLIEEAVRNNDIDRALRHYDSALRVNEESRSVLFPVLAEALGQPAVRRKLSSYMSEPAPWFDGFLRHAIKTSNAPQNITLLGRENGGFPQTESFHARQVELVSRLAATGHYRLAIEQYLALSDSDDSALGTIGFTESTTTEENTPIAWDLVATDDHLPLFVREKGGEIAVKSEVEGGYVGPLAGRLMALRAERYNLTFRHESDVPRGFGNVEWLVTCVDSVEPRRILNRTLQLGSEVEKTTPLVIPADCPVQLVNSILRLEPSTQRYEILTRSPVLEPA